MTEQNNANIITFIREEGRMMLFVDGRELDPKVSQKVHNHSPDGFGAGYPGSAPAQSALAILLHVSKDPALAQRHHQDFKVAFLCEPSQETEGLFSVTVDVKAWLRKREETRTDRTDYADHANYTV